VFGESFPLEHVTLFSLMQVYFLFQQLLRTADTLPLDVKQRLARALPPSPLCFQLQLLAGIELLSVRDVGVLNAQNSQSGFGSVDIQVGDEEVRLRRGGREVVEQFQKQNVSDYSLSFLNSQVGDMQLHFKQDVQAVRARARREEKE